MPEDDDLFDSPAPPKPRKVVRGMEKLQGVQPDLINHWNNLQTEFDKAGVVPTIKSGYRTAKRQNWLHTHGYPTKGNDGYINISPHQDGRSLDIGFNGAQKETGRRIIADYAKRNNLHVPSDEPWHIAIPKAQQKAAAIADDDLFDTADADLFDTPAPPQVGVSATARKPKRDPAAQVMAVAAEASERAVPRTSKAPFTNAKAGMGGGIQRAPSIADIRLADDRQLDIADIRMADDWRGRESTIPAGTDLRVMKGEQPTDRIAYQREGDLANRTPDEPTQVFNSRPTGNSVQARERGLLEPAIDAIKEYTPGLTSLDTPMGIKTDLPRGVARGLTLGAIGDRREISPEEKLVDPDSGKPRIVVPLPFGKNIELDEGTLGEIASGVVPYVGAGKLLKGVAALNQPTRAARIAHDATLFGGVGAVREGIQSAKTGEDFNLANVAIDTAIGAATGGIAGISPSMKRQIFAFVAPAVAAGVARGESAEEVAHAAVTNLLFGLHSGAAPKRLTAQRIGELRKELAKGRTTVPAETQEKLTKGEVNVPEKAETIQAQLDQRGYTLIPDGSPRPPLPRGTRTVRTDGGVVYFDPNRIDAKTIRETPTTELLGHVEPKSETTTETVVARAPDGSEIQSSAVSPENVAKQAEVLQEQYPQAKVETGGPEVAAEVIAERVAPQEYDHLQFGRVVKAEDQTGASNGRTKVFEKDNPDKFHYPKTVDLQGRGNSRMIPVKPARPATEALPAEVAPATASTPELTRRADEMMSERPEETASRRTDLEREEESLRNERAIVAEIESGRSIEDVAKSWGFHDTRVVEKIYQDHVADKASAETVKAESPSVEAGQRFDRQDVIEVIDRNSPGHDIARMYGGYQGLRAELGTEPFVIADVPISRLRAEEYSGEMAQVDPSRAIPSKGPVVLNPDGHIIDGRHRIARAVQDGQTTIKAYVPESFAGKVKSESPSVREGEKPTFNFVPDKSGTGGIVTAQINGETVGRLRVVEGNEESVSVSKDWRRKGIASGLYDLAEEKLGKTLRPSQNLNQDSRAFWRNRLQEYAASESPSRRKVAAQYPEITGDVAAQPKPIESPTGREPAVPTAKKQDTDHLTADQVADILADQHFNKQMGRTKEHLQSKLIQSDKFTLMEIPIGDVGILGENQGPSRSRGPIIVERRDAGTFNVEPYALVIDGAHRVMEAEARGEKTIQAYVGEKAQEFISTQNAAVPTAREAAPPADIALDDPRVTAIVENTNAVQFANRQVAKAEAEVAERQLIVNEAQRVHDETAANSGYSHLLGGRKYELKKAQSLLKSAQAELQKKQELLESERKRKAPIARMEARKAATVEPPAPPKGETNVEPTAVAKATEGAGVGDTSAPSTYGSTNKLITPDRAAAARARLKAKLDPSKFHDITDIASALPDLAELGAFHIEAGSRAFGTWSKEFLKEFNEDDQKKIKPHLEDIFDRASGLINKDTTSARKAQMAQDRADLDLPDLSPAERKSWETTLDNARESGASRRALPLAHNIISKPRALTDTETAGLVLKAQEIKNDYAKIVEEAGAETDPNKLRDLRSEAEMLQGDFDVLSDALKQSGTEKGRALAIQKLTINQDFDQVSMRNRFKARTGKAPSEKIVATIEKQAAEIKTLNEKLAEHEQRVLNDQVSKAAERIRREVARETRQARRSATTAAKKGDLDAEATQLKTLIAAAWKKQSTRKDVAGMAAVDPEGELVKLVLKLARNRIKRGVVTGTGLVDEIHGLLEDVTDLDKRRVAEIISGYGRKGKPRTDLERQLDALKSELYQGLSAEDVAAGKRSPRREGPSMREMVGKVEGPRQSDARKLPAEGPRLSESTERKAGPRLTDAPTQGPKLSEGVGRAAGPRIQDAPRQGPKEREGWRSTEGPRLSEGTAKREGPRISDAPLQGPRPSEANRLPMEGPRLSDANRLKAEGPKLTDAPKLGPKNTWPARKVAIEKQIAELERRIREQDFSKAPKRGATVLDAEGQKLRDKLQAVKKDYEVLVERNSPGRWWRTGSGVRKSGMLSGYISHVKNIFGTGVNLGFEEVRRVPSVFADALMAPIADRRTVTLSPSAMLDGVVQMSTVGLKEASETIRFGAPREQAARQQYREVDTGIKAVNLAVNAVFRFMSASDRTFYNYSYKRNVVERAQAQAKSEARIDKSIDWRKRAKELEADEQIKVDAGHDALVGTFNNSNFLSDAIMKARSGMTPAQNFALDIVLPFDRTPTNVIARVIEASPLGSFKLAKQISKSIWNKEFTAAQQRAIAETFGRATTGSSIMVLGGMLAMKGLLETDDYGTTFMKVPFGPKINVTSIAPVGTLIGMGANLYKQWTKPEGSARNLAGAVLKPVADQPILKATSQVSDLLKDPQRSWEKFGANTAFSFVPFSGAIRTAAQGIDPAEKRYPNSSFKEQFTRDIPGLRENLPASKVRLLGNEVTKAVKEAERLNIKIKGATKQEDETPEEFEKRAAIQNGNIRTQIENVVALPEYDKATDDDKRLWLKQAADFASERTREQLPEKPEKKEQKQFPMPQSKAVGFDSAYPADALAKYERMSAAQRTAVRGSMTRKAKVLLSDPRLSDEQKAEFKARLNALGIAPAKPSRTMRQQFASP